MRNVALLAIFFSASVITPSWSTDLSAPFYESPSWADWHHKMENVLAQNVQKACAEKIDTSAKEASSQCFFSINEVGKVQNIRPLKKSKNAMFNLICIQSIGNLPLEFRSPFPTSPENKHIYESMSAQLTRDGKQWKVLIHMKAHKSRQLALELH